MWERLHVVGEIKESTMSQLMVIPKDDFRDSFEKMLV